MDDILGPLVPESDLPIPASWNCSSYLGELGRDLDLDFDLDTTFYPESIFLGCMDPYFNSFYGPAGDGDSTPLALPSSTVGCLETQVKFLERDLQKLNKAKANPETVVSESSIREFFTFSNFHKLMTAFFHQKQLLARLIHWPSFNPTTVDRCLLLTIVLCGASYSTNATQTQETVTALGRIQRLAEQHVFRRLKEVGEGSTSQCALEVCQAAYLITLLQVGLDFDGARRRIITKRQPALVDTLRTLRVMGKQMVASPGPPSDRPDWSAFVYEESWKRLVSWTLFNEGLLALFCNSPPNAVTLEMNGSLVSCDALWNAENERSFLMEQQNGLECTAQGLSMKKVIAALLDDEEEWERTRRDLYKCLTANHLYEAIGVFQIVLFNYRANTLPKSFGRVLRRALDRWDRLWHELATQSATYPPHRWPSVVKHSPEFSQISRKILEAGDIEDTKHCKYLQCVVQDDFQAFREFISQYY